LDSKECNITVDFSPIDQTSVVLLSGATGYIGRRIVAMFRQRGIAFRVLTRSHVPPLDGVTHVVNAGGFTGSPNVDACEEAKRACFDCNVSLAVLMRDLAAERDLPLIHLSSGCVFFRGKNIPTDAKPDNFTTFYTRSKILAEELVGDYPRAALLRLRMPFDGVNEPRNYLTKILNYSELLDFPNSLTYIPDLVDSLLSISSAGIYHAVNPGSIRVSEIVRLFGEYGVSKAEYSYLPGDCSLAAKRSNVTLVPSFNMPTTTERVRDVLGNWICRQS
jgi:dTDP-4-dehydrorhamnose reductase